MSGDAVFAEMERRIVVKGLILDGMGAGVVLTTL